VTPLAPLASSPGPAIRAIDPWHPGNPYPGEMKQLLSEAQRTRLASISSIVRFAKGAVIYHADDTAEATFNVVSGVVKEFKTASDGSEYIAAFLFPGDLFGLSAEGRYVHSTKAITQVTAYQLLVSAFRDRLLEGAGLGFHVIRKLCHELRQTQRHAFLLSQHSALARLAMFLQMLEQLQSARGEPTAEIYLPMGRSDIGNYVGMSLGAVSRGFQALTRRGVIRSRDRRHVKIVDRSAFEKLAADPYGLFQTTVEGSQVAIGSERRHA
jgi:CRP/FNR family transcriptional regulator, anaerobic regulatory protein